MRDPVDICLLHAIESLEGSIAPLQCLEGDPDDQEELSSCNCAQHWVWQDIYVDTRSRLGEVSLAELAERSQQDVRSAASNYSI
jgi:DNA-binding IscR family transcriptional regulator